MSVGYLPHSFDLFNVAHLDLLTAARERVGRLVVGVLPDAEVLLRTGRAPVVPLAERLEILRHVRGVDEVVVHDDGAPPAGAVLLLADEADVEAPASEHESDEGRATCPVVLPSTRTSTSAALRRALREVADEAVA